MAGILFILSAPSGSGKSTLVSQLRSLVAHLDFSVSYTTRAPRGSEQQGREYQYVSVDAFREMIAKDEFLEWADVFGNYYGTPRQALLDARGRGHDLLLDIDVQGARQVRRRMPEAVSIFILPPNPTVLETRLRNRSRAEGLTDAAMIERRLDKARTEIENYIDYSYILVNDVLDHAVEELLAIVHVERSLQTGVPIQTGDRDHLEALARACRQSESQETLVPILESFGLGHRHVVRAGS